MWMFADLFVCAGLIYLICYMITERGGERGSAVIEEFLIAWMCFSSLRNSPPLPQGKFGVTSFPGKRCSSC